MISAGTFQYGIFQHEHRWEWKGFLDCCATMVVFPRYHNTSDYHRVRGLAMVAKETRGWSQ